MCREKQPEPVKSFLYDLALADMKNKAPYIFAALITLILTWISANINWGEDKPKWIVLADGKGYYAYLPAIFIYHDLNFGFFSEKEMNPRSDPKLFYDYRAYSNGHTINKYFCGTALLQMPFFLAAHLVETLTNGPGDGYSNLYFIFIQIATLFYYFIGLLFLIKLLYLFNFKPFTVIIALITVSFGTNAFYYIVREAAMPHIYAFSLITAFMYFSKKYFTEYKAGILIIMSVLLGLIILVRPVNCIICFILPFVTSSPYNLKRGFFTLFHKPLFLISGVVIFLSVISIQMLIYKLSTGSYIVDTYSDEYFDFKHLHIINFLFSYKKGAFVYTPVLLISLIGLSYFWKQNKYSFYSGAIFLLVIFYILSSLWNWWYGGSFSSRVLIDYYAFFMVLLAAAFELLRKKVFKGLYLAIIVLFILVNQVQIYQYRYGIIHWELMDKQKYWENFLRIDKLI